MKEEYNGYYIEFASGLLGYSISNVGKGVLPVFLRGFYTTKDFAKQRIDAHLAIKAEKNDSTDRSR